MENKIEENKDNTQKDKTSKRVVKSVVIIFIIIIIILLLLHRCSTETNEKADGAGSDTDGTESLELLEVDCDDNICDYITIDNELNIFETDTNVNVTESKIAPGSTGIYVFAVRNSTSFEMSFDVSFEEENEYDMNIQFKLSDENGYIVGNNDTYVKYDELLVKDITISSKEIKKYYLEWKWIDSDNDTTVTQNQASYTIRINIKGTQVL